MISLCRLFFSLLNHSRSSVLSSSFIVIKSVTISFSLLPFSYSQRSVIISAASSRVSEYFRLPFLYHSSASMGSPNPLLTVLDSRVFSSLSYQVRVSESPFSFTNNTDFLARSFLSYHSRFSIISPLLSRIISLFMLPLGYLSRSGLPVSCSPHLTVCPVFSL